MSITNTLVDFYNEENDKDRIYIFEVISDNRIKLKNKEF